MNDNKDKRHGENKPLSIKISFFWLLSVFISSDMMKKEDKTRIEK